MSIQTVKKRIEKIDNEKATRVVLAEGISSGHAHAFYGNTTVSLKGSTLTVNETDILLHEEHGAQVCEPGTAKVVIGREYEMGAVRRVAD